MWQSDPFLAVTAALVPLREQVLNHDLYRLISRPQGLAVFAEHHVFAVWDYHVLVAEVLATTAVTGRLAPADSLAPYREAMTQGHVDTRTIDQFERLLSDGTSWPLALDQACVPRAAARFASRTLTLCQERSPIALAATYLFGRSRLAPALNRRLSDGVSGCDHPGKSAFLAMFRPQVGQATPANDGAIARNLADRCGQDPEAWQTVYVAACGALQTRLAFWDGIAAAIRRRHGHRR